MPALACSVANNHDTPTNIANFIASCPRDFNQNARDLPELDHPPGMSLPSVTRCPNAAHPERMIAGAATQLPTDRAPSKNAAANPNTDARKIPMTMAPPLVIEYRCA